MDPNEANDLPVDPTHRQILREMLKWMRTTEDPLLDGPVPGPPDVTNDPRLATPNDPTSAAER